MVSKCANPECAASFRYFHTGRLFRLEIPSENHGEDEMNKHVSRLEFFWLCDECAVKMTLTFETGSGVSVHPKLAHATAAA